jgi:hypothetical protein
MKKNHKIINEELSRLSEIMGIQFKPLISEQVTEFLEKTGTSLDDVLEKLRATGVRNADELAEKMSEIASKGAESLTTKESEFITQIFNKLFPSEMKATAEEGFMFLQSKLESKPGLYDKIKGFISNSNKSTEEVITALEDRGIVPDLISREEALAMREYGLTVEKGVERDLEQIGKPTSSEIGEKIGDELSVNSTEEANEIGNIIQNAVRENESKNNGKFVFNKKEILAQLELNGVKGSKARKIVRLMEKANLTTPAEMKTALAQAVRTSLKKEGATDAQITKITDRISNIKDFMFENLGFAGKALWWIGIDLLISSTVQFLMWATTLDTVFPTVYAIFQFLGFRVGASIKTIKQSVEKFRGEVNDEPSTTTTTTQSSGGATTTTTTQSPGGVVNPVPQDVTDDIRRNLRQKDSNGRDLKFSQSQLDKLKFTDYDSANKTVKYDYDNGSSTGTIKKESDGFWRE